MIGKQSPYVCLQLNNEKFVSRVHANAGTSCQFQQKFLFNLDGNVEDSKNVLRVDVKAKDSTCGSLNISVKQLAAQTGVVTYNLLPQGSITLQGLFQGSSVNAAPPQVTPAYVNQQPAQASAYPTIPQVQQVQQPQYNYQQQQQQQQVQPRYIQPVQQQQQQQYAQPPPAYAPSQVHYTSAPTQPVYVQQQPQQPVYIQQQPQTVYINPAPRVVVAPMYGPRVIVAPRRRVVAPMVGVGLGLGLGMGMARGMRRHHHHHGGMRMGGGMHRAHRGGGGRHGGGGGRRGGGRR